MTKRFLTPISLANLSADPTGSAGAFYYNTSANTLKYYNGSTWITLASGLTGATAPVTYNSGTQTVALNIGSSLTTSASNLIVDSTVVPYLANANTFTASPQQITVNAATNKGFIIKGAASQTANLQEWQNYSGTVIAKVDASGNISSQSSLNLLGTTPNIYGVLYNNGSASQYAEGSLSTNAGYSTPVMLPNEEGYYPQWAFKTPNVVEYSDDGVTWTVADQTQYRSLFAFQNGVAVTVPHRSLRVTVYQGTFTFTSLVQARFVGGPVQKNVTMKTEVLASDYTTVNQTYGPTASALAYDGAALLQKFNSYNGSTYAIRVTLDFATWVSGDSWSIASLMAYISKPGTSVGGYQNKFPMLWDSYKTTTFQPTNPSSKALIVKGLNLAATISTASASGTAITYTTSTAHNLTAGNTVTIAGVVSTGNPSATAGLGFNLTSATIASVINQTQFTVTNALSDTYTSGGSLTSNQTANLQEWQNSAGTVLSYIDTAGNMNFSSTGSFAQSSTGRALFVVNGTTNVPIIAKGAASQTANLQEWQNSAGTVLASVSNAGDISGKRVAIAQTNAGQIVLDVLGAASQTADLQQWRNSAGTVLGGANALAQIYTGSTSPILVATGGATTAASGDLTTATITTTSAHGLAVGDLVTVAGVTPTGYNATAIVTVVGSTTTFSYFNATTGAQTVAGTVSAPAQASVTTRSAGTSGLIVKGVASQTADLQQWQNSAGTVLASVSTTGAFLNAVTGNITALSISQNAGARTLSFGQGGFISNSPGTFGLSTWNNIGTLEIYSTFASRVGLVIRGIASQTADLQQWQNSAGTSLGGVNAAGQIYAGTTASKVGYTTTALTSAAYTSATVAVFTYGGTSLVQAGQTVTVAGVTGGTYNGTWVVSAATTTTFTVLGSGFTNVAGSGGTVQLSAVASFVAGTTAITPLVVQGAASQTADLQQWQSSAGTPVARVISDGSTSWYGTYNQFLGDVRVGTVTYTGGVLSVLPRIASEAGIVVRGFASQTADLQQWQNTSGTVLSGVNAAGQYYAGSTTSVFGSGTTALTSAAYTSATVAVFTYGGTSLISAGQQVVVAGVTGGTYNGTWTVTAVTGTTFTVVGTGFTNIAGSGGVFKMSPAGYFSANSAAITPLVVQGAASQTANLQEWQNSAGTALVYIGGNGALICTGITYINDANASATGLQVKRTISQYGTVATDIGITVKGAVSQTADLQQWQNSAGTVLLNINASGVIGTSATSTSSTNSAGVSIQTGNATGTTSNSGGVTIDSGTATGTVGSILIGNTNATTITIGRTSGVTTTINGTTIPASSTLLTSTTGQASSTTLTGVAGLSSSGTGLVKNTAGTWSYDTNAYITGSSPTITTPIIDSISASAVGAATSLHPTVTTGSIAIGEGLTTGALNIAASGTGITPITIGHANATIALNGAITTSSTINKVTITAPTTSATLTLITGSTLATNTAASLTLGLSSANPTVAIIPSGTVNLQDLGTAQTITGVKTFSTAPVISTITNTGTITFPTTSGTLMLNPTTTKGDLIIASATGTPGTLSRLAPSATNNYVLGYNTTSAAPQWQVNDFIVPYSKSGSFTTFTGTLRYSPPFGCTILGVSATLGTASSSGAMTFDVLKNGTSIFSTKPTIAQSATATASEFTTFSTSSLNGTTDYLTVSVTIAGTGTADLVVSVRLAKA